jgi:hypothetical protein
MNLIDCIDPDIALARDVPIPNRLMTWWRELEVLFAEGCIAALFIYLLETGQLIVGETEHVVVF